MEIQENVYTIGNLEAEQSILGAILLDKTCIEHIETLTGNDLARNITKLYLNL